MSPSDIADHNSRAALGLIRTFGPLTRQEMSARLGLTEPAVTGIMARLSAQGLIIKRLRTGTGRYHASEFGLQREGACAVGVSLSSGHAQITVIDLSGAVLSEGWLDGTGFQNRLPDMVASVVANVDGPDPLGLGLALAPGCQMEAEIMETLLPGRPTFSMPDIVAALTGERLLGVGEPEGGLVVLLIDETVRASLFIGGKTLRGMNGRAGQIGEMRPGRDLPCLTDIANQAAYRRAAEAGPRALAVWVETAAGRLLDAVVAIAGFVSPGAILIGGALPDTVLDALIARMLVDRQRQASTFVATPWIPPIRRTSHTGGGVALGAAMTPFMELLLPKPA